MEKDCVASFFIKPTDNATALPLTEKDLITLIRAYRYFSRKRAVEVLFRFKYGTRKSKKDCLHWFDRRVSEDGQILCQDSFSTKLENFTDEQFSLLADELQFQYQAKDPMFLDIHTIRGLPRDCQKELDALEEKMSNSLLLFFMTVKKCVKAKNNVCASQWIVQLLSKNSASQAVALEHLGFDFNYRLLLKDFSREIGKLLFALHQNYLQKQKLLENPDIFVLPVLDLLKQINDLDEQVIVYFGENANSGQVYSSDRVYFFENEALEFMKKASNISCKSPNFSILVEYRQKLEDLGNALISLLKVQIRNNEIFSKEENNALLFVAATNISLMQEIYTVQKELNSADSAYRLASESFHKFHCEHFEDENDNM